MNGFLLRDPFDSKMYTIYNFTHRQIREKVSFFFWGKKLEKFEFKLEERKEKKSVG